MLTNHRSDATTTSDPATGLLSVKEAAKLVRSSPQGVLNWVVHGVALSTGERLRLASVKYGWRRWIDPESLAAFTGAVRADDAARIAAVAAKRAAPKAAPPRKREHDAITAQRRVRELLGQG